MGDIVKTLYGRELQVVMTSNNTAPLNPSLEAISPLHLGLMHYLKFMFVGLLSAFSLGMPSDVVAIAANRTMQPLPLSRSGRWIIDAKNHTVPFVGVNWPGAGETMLPEGLGHQSVASIVQKISEFGFNAVRLTFAIEMVDDILDNGGDVTLNDTLTRSMGVENGTSLMMDILWNNPQFTEQTTRLEIFDAVAAELAAQNIYLHLDNHVSKAMWCCALDDGNSWFGDQYFNTTTWIRGLTYMADHGKRNWPSFSSIGLRNELRPSSLSTPGIEPYSWSTWKTYMTAAATAVYNANPDILIFFSGLESDFNIEPAVGGSTLLDRDFSFKVCSYPWAHKLVFEMHEYDEHISGICELYKKALLLFGADATTKKTGNGPAPLVITEWGHSQRNDSDSYKSSYSTCLAEFMVERQLGWMVWVLAGSYYIRSGVQGYDEPYGLLDHNWDESRGEDSIAAIKKLIQDTYAAYGQ
ncbi:Glycoside hydrolase [Venustampulla echinocandica]|uniref:Glycoside hydrolase n=1 Tax=Venustampulla echinocandica TaxID=2656787 RepID=A0A370TW91_9HELO|nr:Glycoside hydrolase [Venustampulla echinocandica]RDL39787.1 Glycoside hydrolase [Venustampulla echinocandica]